MTPNVRNRLKAWASLPVVHFLILGTICFGADRLRTALGATREPARRAGSAVVVTARQVAQLKADWYRRQGREPSPEELEGLLRELVDRELLYQEAVRLGIDRGDLVVRRRLMEKMRVLAGDESLSAEELYRQAVELGLGRDDLIVRRQMILRMRLLAESRGENPKATETELRNYLDRHPERFRRSAQVRLSHVFLSREKYGDRVLDEAKRLLNKIVNAKLGPEQAASLGDPFLLGCDLPWKTTEALERSFGTAFASKIPGFAVGTWSGPVESPYGAHLVWVYEKRSAGPADLDSVREQVAQGLDRERRSEHLADFLSELRQRYLVRIESPDLPDSSQEVGS